MIWLSSATWLPTVLLFTICCLLIIATVLLREIADTLRGWEASWSYEMAMAGIRREEEQEEAWLQNEMAEQSTP